MSAGRSSTEQISELDELGLRFDALTQQLLAGPDGPPDPQRVIAFAARAVPHTGFCGLTLVRGRRAPVTVAPTAELVRRVDAIQYETGQGPCLDAAEGHDLTRVADLAVDRQWPAFGHRCVGETGIHSMFSVRLFLSGQDRAALNFYSPRVGVFDDLDVGIGAMFAPFAALAMQTALLREDVAHLRTALQSSRQIGTAIGILMARQLVTSDQAFAQLVAASQHLNRKLRDIARDVEATGMLPDG